MNAQSQIRIGGVSTKVDGLVEEMKRCPVCGCADVILAGRSRFDGAVLQRCRRCGAKWGPKRSILFLIFCLLLAGPIVACLSAFLATTLFALASALFAEGRGGLWRAWDELGEMFAWCLSMDGVGVAVLVWAVMQIRHRRRKQTIGAPEE